MVVQKSLPLLLFLLLPLFANEYPHFSRKELLIIQNKDKRAKRRIDDYMHQLSQLKSLPKHKQLSKLNLYLNQLLPQYDDVTNKKADSWATPKEFLAVGYGDCEDYVLIKYYSLVHLGFEKDKLYLTLVKVKRQRDYHMVLGYFKTPTQPPLILDNLSFRILPLHKRKDLQPLLFINHSGVYKWKNNKLSKVAQSYKEFEKVHQRVLKNR